MKYRLFILTLLAFVLGGLSDKVLSRTCYPVTLSLGPYVGIDFQMRDMGFKQGFGDNIFEKQYPQGNFFVGLMLNEYLGIELGYERTLRRTRSSSFAPGDTILGNVVNVGSGEFVSRGELYGPNINLIGIYKPCQEYPLEIFGSIGAAYLTAKFDRNLVQFNNSPFSLLRTFERERTVWRVCAGLQYLLMDS